MPEIRVSQVQKLILTLVAFIILITNSFAQVKSGEEEETTTCGGVERWDVKVLTDSKVSTIDFNPITTTVSGLVSIVTPKPSTTMPRYAGVEDKTFRVICKVTIKKNEADGDYHLVFSDGINTFIGEIPNPVCAAASSSAYVNQYITARNFIDTYIPKASNSNVNIPDVEVTGVAFIDPPHGQTGKAPNNIELHPILKINFSSLTSLVDLYEEKALSVNIGPNPAQNKIWVQVNSKLVLNGNCSLQLFDMHGNCEKVFDLPVSGNKNISETLDLINMAKGIHIYRIMNNGRGIYDGKLVIN